MASTAHRAMRCFWTIGFMHWVEGRQGRPQTSFLRSHAQPSPSSFFPSFFLSFLPSFHPSFHPSFLTPATLPNLCTSRTMSTSYSDVVSETTTETSSCTSVSTTTTHERLVTIYESHVKTHGSSPSLEQLFDTARSAASTEHDKDVVRMID